MDLIKRTKEAFFKAVDRAGGKLVRLQEKTGVDYPIINRLNSGKRNFKDISLQTFEKLFPDLQVYFFRDEHPETNVLPSDLSPVEKKLLRLIRQLDEEGKLDLLTEAAALRERQQKNHRAKDKIA